MVLVDSAVYEQGRRRSSPESLEDTYRQLRSGPQRPGRFAWIGLYRPDRQEVSSLAEEFDGPLTDEGLGW